VPQAACRDADTLLGADGESIVECAPYRCHAEARVCTESCSSSTDCAAGFVCDRAGKCVSANLDVPGEGGCAIGRVRRAWPAATLGLLVCTLFARLRLRTRRATGKRREF